MRRRVDQDDTPGHKPIDYDGVFDKNREHLERLRDRCGNETTESGGRSEEGCEGESESETGVRRITGLTHQYKGRQNFRGKFYKDFHEF